MGNGVYFGAIILIILLSCWPDLIIYVDGGPVDIFGRLGVNPQA